MTEKKTKRTSGAVKRYVMAIDQGTTGTRVIFFNAQGSIHSQAYQEIRQIFPKPGWVEHDPATP